MEGLWFDLSARGRDWVRGWAAGDVARLRAAVLVVLEGFPACEVARGLGLPRLLVEHHAADLRESLAEEIAFGRITPGELLRDADGRVDGQACAGGGRAGDRGPLGHGPRAAHGVVRR